MSEEDVTRELSDALLRSRKDYITLSRVTLSKRSREVIKMPSACPLSQKRDLILPYLGKGLVIRKKGSSYYLARDKSDREYVHDFLAAHPGTSPGTVVRGVSLLKKTSTLSCLNSMITEGRVRVEISGAYSIKLTLPALPVADPGITRDDDLMQLEKAFSLVSRGRVFVGIYEVRRSLGWSRERFDSALELLRRQGVVQLHAGDNSGLKPDEVEDSYIDTNRFLCITMTWRRK